MFEDAIENLAVVGDNMKNSVVPATTQVHSNGNIFRKRHADTKDTMVC